MRRFLFFIITSLYFLTHLQAKSLDDMVNLNVDSINTVNINLDGVIILDNSPDNQIYLRTQTKTEGTIIGFSNRKDVGAYQVIAKKKGTVLNIKPVKREKIWTVGINTFSENNTHFVHIPSDKNVVITSKDARIIINGSFALLKIVNEKGRIDITTSKKRTRYIKCKTLSGELWVNDQQSDNTFSDILSGTSVIDVFSKEGTIKLQILD